MPEETFTTHLASDDVRQLTKLEITELDMELVRIKRSSGDTEYATAEMLKVLEARRSQRRNQRKLAAMREDGPANKPQPFRAFLKRLTRT